MDGARLHRLIICIDIERFSQLSDTWQAVARKGMYEALRRAFETCEVLAEYQPEDRGDGALVVLSASVPKDHLLSRFPQALAAELAQYNTEEPQAPVRLRVAVHAGEVAKDDHGFVGDAVNKAFRLCEAQPLKDVLAASPGALAVIVSEAIYHDVIRHIPSARPEIYRRIDVAVKETDTTAWICLPDAPDFLSDASSGLDLLRADDTSRRTKGTLRLSWERADETTLIFETDDFDVSLGRNPANRVHLPDERDSRFHGKLTLAGSTLLYHHLGAHPAMLIGPARQVRIDVGSYCTVADKERLQFASGVILVEFSVPDLYDPKTGPTASADDGGADDGG